MTIRLGQKSGSRRRLELDNIEIDRALKRTWMASELGLISQIFFIHFGAGPASILDGNDTLSASRTPSDPEQSTDRTSVGVPL